MPQRKPFMARGILVLDFELFIGEQRNNFSSCEMNGAFAESTGIGPKIKAK
jgi:hypothetical protein